MKKAQEKKIAKIARKFQKEMQALVDDNKSGITGISIGIPGEKMITVAGEPNEAPQTKNDN